MGIWAVKELGATSTQLSYGYLLMAAVGGIVGYGAGHLSDHFGRRRVILAGQGILAVYVLLFLTVGGNIWFGLGLMVGAAGSGVVRRLGGSGDGGRPRPAGAARGGVRLGARGRQPRRHDGAADREPLPPRRWLDALLPVRQPARPDRLGACLPVSPEAWRLRARGAAGAGIVGSHPPGPHLPRLHARERLRVGRLRRVRDGAADLARREPRCTQLGMGLPARRQPAPRDVLPAAPDATRHRHSRCPALGGGDAADGACRSSRSA